MHNLTTTQQQTHPENSIIEITNKEETRSHTAEERRNLSREQEQEREKAEHQEKNHKNDENTQRKKKTKRRLSTGDRNKSHTRHTTPKNRKNPRRGKILSPQENKSCKTRNLENKIIQHQNKNTKQTTANRRPAETTQSQNATNGETKNPQNKNTNTINENHQKQKRKNKYAIDKHKL